ncbi:MAG: alpha/beta fold hydrolase [Deltaproteobacteria bacterium]|nr:alpha/beta fold hydrolase [Deltaproteobacteria bacterium]
MSRLTRWWQLLRGKINLARICLRTSVLFFLFPLFFSLPAVSPGEAPAISRELHWAVTGEKFELALERLYAEKRPRHRSPVVLIHGIFVNSRLFNLDEDQSLARYLASEGFDVWNLSLRGTGRSLNPLRGGPKSWTLDDMVDRDLSAVVRYVRKESSSSKILWLGYEMGGLLLYGHLEKRGASDSAALVTIGAPVTFNHPLQEPLKGLLRLEGSPALKRVLLSLNTPFFARLLLPFVPKIERLFYNPENIEEEVKAALLEDALAEVNPGVLDHLLLMIKRGEFVSARGDFSYRRNLAKIQLPILFIGGEGDVLAPPETIRVAHRAVSSKDRTLRIFGPRSKDSIAYGHVDLILGRKAREEVFPVIGRWLKQRDRRE